MSLDIPHTVDAAGIEKQSGVVVLTIIDSWDWTDELTHLRALQDKLNAYFGFVESGEIYSAYPSAAGRSIRIDLVSRCEPPARALTFLESAASAASELGITLSQRAHSAVDSSAGST